MDEEQGSDGYGLAASHLTLAMGGLMFVVFAVIPQTRPFALVVVMFLGPAVAFGSLIQVFRADVGLRSAGGIILALFCGVLGFVAIPLGFIIIDETIAEALQIFGLIAALVAIVFARLSLEEEPTDTDRYVPEIDFDLDEDVPAVDESSVETALEEADRNRRSDGQ